MKSGPSQSDLSHLFIPKLVRIRCGGGRRREERKKGISEHISMQLFIRKCHLERMREFMSVSEAKKRKSIQVQENMSAQNFSVDFAKMLRMTKYGVV